LLKVDWITKHYSTAFECEEREGGDVKTSRRGVA